MISLSEKLQRKSLNVSQLTELITNGRTGTIRGFKSKMERNLMPVSVWKKDENGKTVIKFDFEHVEAKKSKRCCLSALWRRDHPDTVWVWMCELYER